MKSQKNQSHLYRYFIIYFILITFAFMLIYALMTNTANALDVRRLMIIPLLIIIFIFTNLFALYLLKKVFILNRKYEKVEMELIKYRYLESDLKLYRQHRHDMKNHLTVMYELCKNKNYDDLELYTQQYIQKTSNKLQQVNTGADELDVLIYNKIDQAKAKSIAVDYHCRTELIINNHSVIDIVSIFSNLMDNAIEANKAISSPNGRMISINIEDDQLDYVFVVTNAFINDALHNRFSTDGFTTKSDKQNHGLGLGIVYKLVHRYNGKISIDVFNDKFFQIKVELPKHVL